MGRLEDKTALVTGGGNGIGRASALRFAEEGARLVIVDLKLEAAEAVAAAIEAAGGRALPVAGDVTDEASVDRIVSSGIETFGSIDVLLNSAGGGSTRDGPVTELELDEFWRTIRVDLFGSLRSRP